VALPGHIMEEATSREALLLAGGAAILVNERQRGNPVLTLIKAVPWEFAKVGPPDYVTGKGVCAVFVSLQYHLLHPRYAVKRMRAVGREFRVRVLLILADSEDSDAPLQELCRDAIAHGFTVLVGWSSGDVARYLESLKSLEKATASGIAPRRDRGTFAEATSVLTTIRSINRSDVVTLSHEFENVASLCRAQPSDVLELAGLGEHKARRLVEALNHPLTALGPEAVARTKVGLPREEIVEEGQPSRPPKRDRSESGDESGPPPQRVREASVVSTQASTIARLVAELPEDWDED
jgi:DNA excision repair protein ERCC-1